MSRFGRRFGRPYGWGGRSLYSDWPVDDFSLFDPLGERRADPLRSYADTFVGPWPRGGGPLYEVDRSRGPEFGSQVQEIQAITRFGRRYVGALRLGGVRQIIYGRCVLDWFNRSGAWSLAQTLGLPRSAFRGRLVDTAVLGVFTWFAVVHLDSRVHRWVWGSYNRALYRCL